MSSQSEPHEQVPLAPDKFLAEAEKHWPKLDKKLILKGYELALESHKGQVRQSGEPYVNHPIQVATIVAKLGLDEHAIIAALLHDVLEDTNTKPEKISEIFGDDVLHMIEGVTKLKLNISASENEKQKIAAESHRAAESLRKLLLAMAQDFRVMVIKLADRLHNMETIGHLPERKQTRIATETLDIYAPIAARLGIWELKWQLEDLAFKILHPDEFASIKEMVAKSRELREKELNEATLALRQLLDEKGLKHVRIMGRPKHLYSIFNKHVKQGVPFEEIYDLIALRIITAERFECYLALGLVYELWEPIAGLYSDYITTPKPNGYQSIHTKVKGPSGEPLEIQIRSEKMHEIADFGVAAHWAYKEQGEDAKTKTEKPLQALRKQLFDWSRDNAMSSDFLRSVSTDLFAEQVFAFTPKGDVLDLPSGSTVIDFAFRVHTNLGTKLVGAKINGKQVPLSTEIENGDMIELQTSSKAEPNLDWLRMAKSSHTRSKLRAYLRKQNKSESTKQGRTALEREIKAIGFDAREVLNSDAMKEIASEMRDCKKPDDVYARVGEGIISAASVINRLRNYYKGTEPELRPRHKEPPVPETTTIKGSIDNSMYKRAKCCQPVPGEDVVGYVTKGRGIMIHRRMCPNMQRLIEDDPARIMPFEWQDNSGEYTVSLKIVMIDRRGLLNDITAIIADGKANVAGAMIKVLPNQSAEINIAIGVRNLDHLRDLMVKIGNYSDVLSVLRVFGPGARK